MRATKYIVAAALAVTLLFGVVLGLFMSFLPSGAPEKQPINTTTVLRQVQGLSELVTVKYVMEKVVVFEDPKWYGGDKVLLLAHGIVKAGIDMQQMQPGDLKVENEKLLITLPKASITDAYLDDTKTQVIERETGLLRRVDKDLEQNARKIAVADIRRAARYAGILSDAQSRAQLQLTAFCSALGFNEVVFVEP